MWVLVLIVSFYNFSAGGGGSTSVTTIDFNSEALCKQAASSYFTHVANPAVAGAYDISAKCLRKS